MHAKLGDCSSTPSCATPPPFTSVEHAVVSADAIGAEVAPPPCLIASATCPHAAVSASPTGAGTVTLGAAGAAGAVPPSGTVTATEALPEPDPPDELGFAVPPTVNETAGWVVVVVVVVGFCAVGVGLV